MGLAGLWGQTGDIRHPRPVQRSDLHLHLLQNSAQTPTTHMYTLRTALGVLSTSSVTTSGTAHDTPGQRVRPRFILIAKLCGLACLSC